ncbi:MAG: hypothetical protein AAF360_10230, partial [Pseudomonadota bacterium]
MAVSGTGQFKVDSALGELYVDEGEVTVTGDAGGFNVTFGAYEIPGTSDVSTAPVRVGYDGFGPATLTLVGGGDGVSLTVEDDETARFPATIQVGVGGQTGAHDADGTLNITAGARVVSRNSGEYDPALGFTDGGSYNVVIGRRGAGEVTVDGAGSFLGAYGAEPRITVGWDGGEGALDILNGGDAGTARLEVGRGDGSTGRVLVSGAGSTLLINNDYGVNQFFDGRDNSVYGPSNPIGRQGGDGTLEIADGGVVTISNVDGLTDSIQLDVGQDYASTGRVIVHGAGATLNISQIGPVDDGVSGNAGLKIGRGGRGVVDIYDDGVVNVTGGDAFVSIGRVRDDQATSRSNQLNISDGGALNIDSFTYAGGGMNIAQDIGTNGIVTVEGEGSAINIMSDASAETAPDFGAFLQVGRRGDGELFVLDGADITIDGGGDEFPVFFVGVGEEDGSVAANGYAKISGAGSTVTVTGDNPDGAAFVAVGRREGAYGSLVIDEGGVLTATGAMEIAGSAPGRTGDNGTAGNVLVTGENSKIDIGEDLTVSADIVDLDRTIDTSTGGAGRLDVEFGADVAAERIFVGDRGAVGVRE